MPKTKEIFFDEKTRSIFAQVFDESTIQAVHGLAEKGLFDVLEFVISTGKEAHVFRAVDRAGNFRAVKIYKISTSSFRHMSQYITGDIRFKKVSKDKREIVFAWTKKEFKNLEKARKANVRVPLALNFKKNVLVMEFIGVDGEAAPTLKESKAVDAKKVHEKFVEWIAKMLKDELIHADFSEYNVLNNGKELVLIDMGQAVLTTHPKAREFFERDVRNAVNYLNKLGEKISEAELTAEIKAFKEKM